MSYRLSAPSVDAFSSWIASPGLDRSTVNKVLAWLQEFADDPTVKPSVRVPSLEQLHAYLVPDTDVVVAAIVDDGHEMIDLVEVETLPQR